MKQKTKQLLHGFSPAGWGGARWLAALLAAAALTVPGSRAAQIWNGPLTTFSEPGTDPTLEVNQDRLTSNVWITRAASQGIFNAAQENGYTHLSSPVDTEWAYGALADYASLTYANWETWNGGHPPSMVGQPAVVHLISDDIYLAVTFTFWGGIGGGFAYQRSTPVPPAAARVAGSVLPGQGGFRITFTNTPGLTFSLLATTNLSLSATNWPLIGVVTDAPPSSGLYQFTDLATTSGVPSKFYRLRWP